MELAGDMGCQMFQYAHGLALSRRFGGVPLRIHSNKGHANFALDHFGVRLDGSLCALAEPIVDDAPFNAGREWPTFEAICESRAAAFKISGCFQSEGFFKGVEDEIRSLFKIVDELPIDCADSSPIGIHLSRRSSLDREHEALDANYFLQAIRIIRSLVSRPQFVVVSDDPKWCRHYFAGFEGLVILPDDSPLQTLGWMNACEAFILSNSTLGWWAAWLKQSALVIAPRQPPASSDIYPERWIRIPTRTAELPAPEGVATVLQAGIQGKIGKSIWELLGFAPLRSGQAVCPFPKLVHQTWISKTLPPLIAECVASVRRLNPSWSHRFHTDEDWRPLVEESGYLTWEQFCSLPTGIQKADVFRILALHRYGGVYCDVDMMAYRPLDDMLAEIEDSCIAGTGKEVILTCDHPAHSKYIDKRDRVFANNFMIARPKSRLTTLFLEEISRTLGHGRRFNSNDPVGTTGPVFLTQLIESHGGPSALGVAVIPSQWINPLPDLTLEQPTRAAYESVLQSGEWLSIFDPYFGHFWWHSNLPQTDMMHRYQRFLFGESTGNQVAPPARRPARLLVGI